MALPILGTSHKWEIAFNLLCLILLLSLKRSGLTQLMACICFWQDNIRREHKIQRDIEWRKRLLLLSLPGLRSSQETVRQVLWLNSYASLLRVNAYPAVHLNNISKYIFTQILGKQAHRSCSISLAFLTIGLGGYLILWAASFFQPLHGILLCKYIFIYWIYYLSGPY